MKPLILVTGATGYVGGLLLKALLAAGHRVRCLARRPEVLRAQAPDGAEVVAGDVLDAASVRAAMEGVHTAYYLVHSMGSVGSFEEQDRAAAQIFGEAARKSGVRRIVYLGALGSSSQKLSAHLRSRHEVGEILRSSGVPVIEFRASIVIGAGSLSFEMIRSLVERLPVMIAPRWVSAPAQPIASSDLVKYLLAALNLPPGGSRMFEIGGPDQVSYGGLMREYASQRGLKRLVISVPVLTPRLSSLWLGLVTPLYVRVGRKLIDSIRHATVVEDTSALTAFEIHPVGFREAIQVDRGSSASGKGVRANPTNWRRYRLVLRQLALAFARRDGPDGGRSGAETRTPGSGGSPGWRHCGLLARRYPRTWPPVAPGRRNETTRTRLAGVRGNG
jgi:uncharacterized protein YbjT (DUF2867 family)